jgi:hypothetical protein
VLGRAVHATNEAAGTKSRWHCASNSVIAYAHICTISHVGEAAAANTGHASIGLLLFLSPPHSSLYPHAAHQRGPITVPPACSTALCFCINTQSSLNFKKRGTGLWHAHRGRWTVSATTGRGWLMRWGRISVFGSILVRCRRGEGQQKKEERVRKARRNAATYQQTED